MQSLLLCLFLILLFAVRVVSVALDFCYSLFFVIFCPSAFFLLVQVSALLLLASPSSCVVFSLFYCLLSFFCLPPLLCFSFFSVFLLSAFLLFLLSAFLLFLLSAFILFLPFFTSIASYSSALRISHHILSQCLTLFFFFVFLILVELQDRQCCAFLHVEPR